METPVLYFYSPSQETVSVKINFSKGVITEWYPHASRVEPRRPLNDLTLYHPNQPDGSITWDAVTLSPFLAADLPREVGSNRYYAPAQLPPLPFACRRP